MKVYHTTPLNNRAAILKTGLLVSMASGTFKRIWLHDWQRSEWARDHIAQRYAMDRKFIHRFAVEVKREWLTKFSNGIWTCNRDLPPEHLYPTLLGS